MKKHQKHDYYYDDYYDDYNGLRIGLKWAWEPRFKELSRKHGAGHKKQKNNTFYFAFYYTFYYTFYFHLKWD